MWDDLRKDPNAFNKAAREQASAQLASAGGIVQPFGRNTTGTPQLEKVAFDQLELGDVSPILETPQGYVVIKLLERIPPDRTVKLEDVRAKLEEEIIRKKMELMVPEVFAELRKQADPRLLLKKYETQEQLERDVQKELDAPLPGMPTKGK
jgi:parvulin-like peptidyl-prolyl isomerase